MTMVARYCRSLLLLVVASVLVACAGQQIAPDECPEGTQKLAGCPPLGAIVDAEIAELYADRTWIDPAELDVDVVAIARDAEIPINSARAKFIGSTDAGGLTSLAAKIWLIENAEHTIDVMYYIFADDLIGHAMLGALCDAVQRGIDVRIMVDSLGSFAMNKGHLKALKSCAIDAGFMRNENGELTVYKARVQAIVFNAISKIFVNANRRSHDKLLVIDGHFPQKTAVMTGGRNISLAYYGILEDGSPNPHTYRDAEIFLRGGAAANDEIHSVGEVAEIYYSLLFHFKNNKLLKLSSFSDPKRGYRDRRDMFRESLAKLRALTVMQPYFEKMPTYTSEQFHIADVVLAHEFTNLTDKKVVSRALENAASNPNSITTIFGKIRDEEFRRAQIISPYLFAAQYFDDEGNLLLDEAQNMLDTLKANPEYTIDIVTNSVLTSDNFSAQSVIDMDLAPRLLLTPELQEEWLRKREESEFNVELVESDAWKEMINHPRLRIYETGQLDDRTFGGDVDHAKLHAKYVVGDDVGFVGTTNFDYRSRLYNNEMGFFFLSQPLADELRENTDYLMSVSYRWGSPDWLEMRRKLMEGKGMKARTTRQQRAIYKTLKKTGLHWFF